MSLQQVLFSSHKKIKSAYTFLSTGSNLRSLSHASGHKISTVHFQNFYNSLETFLSKHCINTYTILLELYISNKDCNMYCCMWSCPEQNVMDVKVKSHTSHLWIYNTDCLHSFILISKMSYVLQSHTKMSHMPFSQLWMSLNI